VRLPLTAGSRAAAILGGHGHAADFRVSVGRNGQSLIASIREDGADRLLCIGKRFLLRIALGDDLRKSWDKNGEATAFLRFKHDREAVLADH
jgi:hypothetical protein